MRGNTSSSQIESHDQAWSEIELLVDEAAHLARMPTSSQEFYSELIKRLAQATCARLAAPWSVSSGTAPELVAQVGTTEQSLLATRARNVTIVAREHQATSLAPHQQTASSLVNESGNPLDLQPVIVDGDIVAVFETYLADSVSPSETNNASQLVGMFAELAVEFHRNCELRELRDRETSWTDLESFAESVHQSVDLKRTAFAMANEAARVTGCDRTSVFRAPDKRCKTLAISGIDSFDRRSKQVRAAEKLAIAVAATGEPLWYCGIDDSLPPQLIHLVQKYSDLSHTSSLAVIPLVAKSKANDPVLVGVSLFERFDNEAWTDTLRRRVDFTCRHGATALHNASEFASVPLIGINRALGRIVSLFSLRQIPKTLAVATILTAVIVALSVVQVDFNIRGEGQLVPTQYRHIFAPADGIIEKLDVRHAQVVSEGDPLVQLRRPDLELDETRVLGDILTNQQRLATVQSAILNYKPGSPTAQDDLHSMTSEKERLNLLLESLHQQQTILAKERKALSISSPLDGEVLTWGIEDQLSHRPVRRGERLMSIADPASTWQLDLRVADREIEHILAAREDSQDLSVSFVLTSAAGKEYKGTVETIAMATELDERNQPTVLIRVAFDKRQIPELRPGATVHAKVHCGERPAGYVWLRELIDVVKTRVLF